MYNYLVGGNMTNDVQTSVESALSSFQHHLRLFSGDDDMAKIERWKALGALEALDYIEKRPSHFGTDFSLLTYRGLQEVLSTLLGIGATTCVPLDSISQFRILKARGLDAGHYL